MISKKELEERYDQELKNIQAQIKKPNIFIIGKTGVGKSSLINNVFGEDCATVSDFKPETRGVKRYVHNDVVLFDTEGLELDEKNEASFHKEVLGEIEKRKIGPEKDQIHLIWYLVSATSDRITDYELAVYERLKKYNIPIAIVFTKSDTANEENVNKMLQRFYPKLTFAKSFNDYDTPRFIFQMKKKMMLVYLRFT